MAKTAFTNNDSCVDHVPDWTVDKIRVENKNLKDTASLDHF